MGEPPPEASQEPPDPPSDETPKVQPARGGGRWSRRRILSYGGTAVGGLAIGGYAGAGVQRWLDRGEIPPNLGTHGMLNCPAFR
jgi:hypothetical protein